MIHQLVLSFDTKSYNWAGKNSKFEAKPNPSVKAKGDKREGERKSYSSFSLRRRFFDLFRKREKERLTYTRVKDWMEKGKEQLHLHQCTSTSVSNACLFPFPFLFLHVNSSICITDAIHFLFTHISLDIHELGHTYSDIKHIAFFHSYTDQMHTSQLLGEKENTHTRVSS